jgi:hypothetical protein
MTKAFCARLALRTLSCAHSSSTRQKQQQQVRGVAYALRAAVPGQAAAAAPALATAWWAFTSAGLGFAVAANAAALSSWYLNAKPTSRPAAFKAWSQASQAGVLGATVFGPAMGVAAAGLAHGGRTAEAVATAANVRAASVVVR